MIAETSITHEQCSLFLTFSQERETARGVYLALAYSSEHQHLQSRIENLLFDLRKLQTGAQPAGRSQPPPYRTPTPPHPHSSGPHWGPAGSCLQLAGSEAPQEHILTLSLSPVPQDHPLERARSLARLCSDLGLGFLQDLLPGTPVNR